MRASAAVVALCMTGSAHAFVPAPALPTRTKALRTRMSASEEAERIAVNKKDERRRILASPKYNRMGFKSEAEDVSSMMLEEFTSPMVKELKSNSNVLQKGDVTVKLAQDFGFCWGVERAVAMSFQARKHFPSTKMHITNELIHNPGVNEKLDEMDIEFVPVNENGKKDFSAIQDGDVVILPAFGATLEEMQLLDSKDVQIVDTTCPWVSKVWNTVDKHTKMQFTTVMHGKYAHEETIATSSFADKYIVVKDLKEAQYVADYIVNGGNKEEFLAKFSMALSAGFDPDTDLQKVGLANQTTMYKRDTREIGKIFEKALMAKYGPAAIGQHYMAFDTICDATQERQDAMLELVEDPEIDIMLVVGGWDSSNTHHLAEISLNRGIPTYWVNKAECVKPDGSIDHKDPHTLEVINHPNFLPKGKVCVGLTSGASTPDAYMQQTVENIFLLKQLQPAMATA
ncbi:4-hydroxy-3-methylbut-2-enyl diphosphate reductase chloroplast precursor [Tribonema minus]|uniref:4-hydroxy-3-methylbut-2-enyl diphosphate reductase n=1 Tax=Tribonema minus TaxID=303371 RepID=A0A835ZE64_9STRA|nr:4-hydroxy-3-methylbut-2-enyl diphosphate reductase chloroplast precursor [Tribonema minus]